MSEAEEDLEEIIRRPAPRERARGPATTTPSGRCPFAPPPHRAPAEFLGQCECGARITPADLYGERGDADLGRPRRRPAERFLQYRCPLCGRVGELRAES